MTYALIANPGSRSGRSRKKIARIEAFFIERELDYTLNLTSCLEDAFRLCREAIALEVDVIVAIGGDGTINRVINGFFEGAKLITKARFAVIYTGTSPDFCKSYHIPYGHLEDSLRTIEGGKTIPLKVGVVAKGGETVHFAVCANIGIGGRIAHGANQGIRGILGDRLGTFIAMMRAFFNFKPLSCSLLIDGQEHRFDRLLNISIGRCRHIASGIKVDFEEGFRGKSFYIYVLRAVTASNLLGTIKTLYRGRSKNCPTVSLLYGDCVEISQRDIEIEADGDPLSDTPASFYLTAESIPLICRG